MATKKKTKKVKYAEFLAWLEGVESMQEATWTPNNTQWKTIREKLNTVVPNVEIRETEIEIEPERQNMSAMPMAPPSAFEPQQKPVPLRPQLSAHQTPSEHEGVPASNSGPIVDANGNLPAGGEFL